MIKALIFDNNGVLTKTEDSGISEMSKLLGVNRDDFLKVWKECAKPLDDGGITTEDFLNEVVKTFGSTVDVERIRELYYSCYDRDDEMHEIVNQLGNKYEIALLSNFGDSFDKFEEKWRTHETIKPENMFVSVKLGMRKPHNDIYEHALLNLDLKPHETIFIDDRLENTTAAEKLGMNAILFENKEQFLLRLAEMTSND